MNIRVFAAGVIPTDARHGREIVLTDDSEVAVEEKRVGAVFDTLGSEFGTRGQTADPPFFGQPGHRLRHRRPGRTRPH